MSDYPEHEKVRAIKDKSQIIGEFLEWLNRSQTHLCVWDNKTERFYPEHTPIDVRLADYFGIDLTKVEEEKRAMLDILRSNLP